MLRHIQIAIFSAVVLCVAQASCAQSSISPCWETGTCKPDAAPSRASLQSAWESPATTPEQKQQMIAVIKDNTSDGVIAWDKAATDYFSWRRSSGGKDVNFTIETVAERDQKLLEWRDRRQLVETAIRAVLVDPASAEFEWPYGFAEGRWGNAFSKKIEGYLICGLVNARNRMGGYSGKSMFYAVVNYHNVVHDITMDDAKGGLASFSCNRLKSNLPEPQPRMLEGSQLAGSRSSSSNLSTADELLKLAQLKEQGLLTQAEFDSQKTALLQRR